VESKKETQDPILSEPRRVSTAMGAV